MVLCFGLTRWGRLYVKWSISREASIFGLILKRQGESCLSLLCLIQQNSLLTAKVDQSGWPSIFLGYTCSDSPPLKIGEWRYYGGLQPSPCAQLPLLRQATLMIGRQSLDTWARVKEIYSRNSPQCSGPGWESLIIGRYSSLGELYRGLHRFCRSKK